MRAEIPLLIGFRTLPIPTAFVAHVLALKSRAEPAHCSPVGNHLFPVSRQRSEHGGIPRTAAGFVPDLSAYATKMRVSFVLAR